MALQSSGPISWSTLNLAYGNASNASLSISTIRNTTRGVGLSNVSMSNFQNACIPYPSYCMYRELSNSTTQFTNNASGNTIFNNSNGTIAYVNSTSVPDRDYYSSEWTGQLILRESGWHKFYLNSDDGSELYLSSGSNNTYDIFVNQYYGIHGMEATSANATSNNLTAGVYNFRLRYQEWTFGQGIGLYYAPPSSGTYNVVSFSNNITYNYKPIIKFDANDLAYRQGLSVNSTIATWSNNGTDGTLRHATGLSANASTLATLTSDANGYMVSFDRTKQQYFSMGNLEFDQFRSSDVTPNTIKGLTTFVVGRMSMTDIGNWERFFDFGNGANTSNLLMSRYGNSSSQLNVDVYANGNTAGISRYHNSTIDGGFHVYTISYTNGSPPTMVFYVDNQAITYGVTNRVTPSGPALNRILTINYLGRSNWSDAFLTANIREVLMFREVIDSTTLSRMNRYLMYKWGIQAHMPPVTSGIVGLYTGESWTGSQWTDLSGSGNHVTTYSGTISTSTQNSFTTLTGTTTSRMTWPSAILPATYTLFHVAKYNGTTFNRIFQGESGNDRLSGFWRNTVSLVGGSGVAHHNGWITQNTTNVHGTNWVLSTDQNSLYRSNGTDRTTGAPGTPSFAILNINTGAFANESSEWAVASVVVYNRTLSTNEIVQVETYLNRRYAVY
jgi:hypothetical protein